MENEEKKVSPEEEVIIDSEGTVEVDVKDEENAEVIEEAKETIVDEEKQETKKVKKPKISKLKEENIKLKAENAELKAKYLKAYAEMENSKKRINNQFVIDRKYSSQKLLGELISPVDMLTKATGYESTSSEMTNFLMGFKMIASQITGVLESEGLVAIKSVGEKFNPKIHHAVVKEHVEGTEPDIVLEEQQTGYMYKDRVLRPAMVKVSE